MENRYNVQLIVPCLYMTYDILIPVNKNIAEIITVIIKGLKILTNSNFSLNQKMHLYNAVTGEEYEYNLSVLQTNIKNGSKLILN